MKKAGILMIIGSALLLGLFLYPLWHIHLVAPQYPEGLGMNIYITNIVGQEEFDLPNIDMLNHYIGMKPIPKPGEMWEFDVFPKVVGGMAGIGILLGILGFFKVVKPNAFLIWLIVMSVLGLLGMYDFNQWLLDYGTDLDPNASIRLLDASGKPMVYKPPLIGHVKLLNFDVDSWPHTGAYLMFAGMIIVFISYIVGRKSLTKSLSS